MPSPCTQPLPASPLPQVQMTADTNGACFMCYSWGLLTVSSTLAALTTPALTTPSPPAAQAPKPQTALAAPFQAAPL